MSYRPRRFSLAVPATLIVAALALAQTAEAGFIRGSAVGGVSIDVQGVVAAPTVQEQRQLAALWRKALEDVPGELEPFSELRMVSLKRLEAEIAEHRRKLLPLPESVQCLAGLLRVQYVFVFPEQNDIVLAGPAEGWRVDELGNLVGKTTGRPVLMLEDLMAALRTRKSSAQTTISCSIDPTPEGLRRLQQLRSQLRTIGNRQETLARMEEALGDQVITVTGVPDTCHIARVMVAADFRMKRIAMNFERSPVPDLPSYLQMVKGRPGNAMPRWWLAPDYEPLRTGANGLAWELRGQGVKCLTEDSYLTDEGDLKQTKRTSKSAERWAELMTQKYDELAQVDSAFGHLRNVMDLVVIAALIEKESLLQRSGLEIPRLLDEELLEQYNPPRSVASKASFVKRGRQYVTSVSGGVEVQPWEIVLRDPESSQAVTAIRSKAEGRGKSWWWD